MQRLLGKIADYIRECDKILLGLCVFASLYGCVAVLSATYHVNHSPRQFFVQFGGLVIGIIAVIIISTFNYKNIERLWPLLIGVSVLLVVLTFFIGYAPPGADDKAWLKLVGGMTLQPSELLKVAFIISFGYHLSVVEKTINRFTTIIPLLLHAGAIIVLIHLQGDDGTAAVFAVIFAGMMWSAGIHLGYVIAAIAALACLSPFIYFFIMNEDQQMRLRLMFDVESDLLGAGWQQWQARIAMANGRFFGMGFMKGSAVQSGAIPEGENDFIFSSIGEEFGMLGCIVVMIILFAICLRILKIGNQCDEKSEKFMCVGVASMIFAQTVINIGMNISLLPVIGITLPFFSAGGTSLVCLFFSIGIVMSAYMDKNRGALHLRG